MNIHLPLEDMTTAEKLDTIERLWNSICEDEKSVDSPAWHKEILQKREHETFIDWEQAKRDIRNSIHDR